MVARRYPREDTETCAPREAREDDEGRWDRGVEVLVETKVFQLVAVVRIDDGAEGIDTLLSRRTQVHDERPGAMSRMVPSGAEESWGVSIGEESSRRGR